MQIPNAAGFIPSQSVVDGLLNIFNTFGKDAKDKRQAELGQTRANTANVQARTDWLPDQQSQGWAQIGNEGKRIEESTRQANMQDSQFWAGRLPLDYAQLDQQKQLTLGGQEIDQQRLNNQSNQFWGGALPIQQQEVDQRGMQLGQQNSQFYDQANRDWAQIGNQSQKLETEAKVADAQIKQYGDKSRELIEMFKALSMSNAVSPEAQKSLVFDILNNLGAQGPADQTKLEVDQVNQARQGVIDRPSLNGKKSSSNLTPRGMPKGQLPPPAPGLPGMKDTVNNWILNMFDKQGAQPPAQSNSAPAAPSSSSSLNQLQVPSDVPTASASTPSLDKLFALLRSGQGTKGNATIFGHMLDGSPDPEDNGLGAFGANTRDPKLEGVSLPFATLDQNFGSHRNANDIRNALVAVLNPKTGLSGSFPIVDKGPAGWTGNAIDLTGAAGKRLGATGKDEMIFQILKSLPKT